MARFVSFSPFNTTGTPGAGGLTLDALMKRQSDLARNATQLPAAQEMASPWQGAAYLANVLGDKVSQGRAANDVAATREALAKVTAGIDYDAGPSSEQIAQVQQFDPDLAEKLLQQKIDRAREQRGYDYNNQSREDAQAFAASQATRKTVTGPEAAAMGLPADRVWQVAPGGGVTDITPTQLDEWKDFVDPRQPNVPMQRNEKTGEVKAKGVQTKITSADLKSKYAQEDQVVVLDNALTNLKRASELNEKVPVGIVSQAQAGLRGNLPDWVPGKDIIAGSQEAADASKEFWGIMDQEALTAMANTLTGATTNFELNEFKRILSDPSSSVQVRRATIDRMMALAQRQRELAQARLDDINNASGIQSPAVPPPPSSGAAGTDDTITVPPREEVAAPPAAAAPTPEDITETVARAKAAIAAHPDKRQAIIDKMKAGGYPTEGL